mgnify:CR=1 FL=1
MLRVRQTGLQHIHVGAIGGGVDIDSTMRHGRRRRRTLDGMGRMVGEVGWSRASSVDRSSGGRDGGGRCGAAVELDLCLLLVDQSMDQGVNRLLLQLDLLSQLGLVSAAAGTRRGVCLGLDVCSETEAENADFGLESVDLGSQGVALGCHCAELVSECVLSGKSMLQDQSLFLSKCLRSLVLPLDGSRLGSGYIQLRREVRLPPRLAMLSQPAHMVCFLRLEHLYGLLSLGELGLTTPKGLQ